MTTSIVVCNPDKFKLYTNEANGLYPVLSIENNDTRQEVRILLKDYSQLETLITALQSHYENFIASESETERT